MVNAEFYYIPYIEDQHNVPVTVDGEQVGTATVSSDGRIDAVLDLNRMSSETKKLFSDIAIGGGISVGFDPDFSKEG